ncbi:MFS transporter [Macrococcoides caseolyticum]|uniref:MFS transporter n=1 Tax=Macrococcoides caseolyticum TaxID=69966 RepID=UPI001F33C1FE|nr:MFS transporter [Macrococcus caseolyticus]MCE4955985.1 MFS transporter [Macrococcus caseolyticus]
METPYKGGNKLVLGIVLSILTYWLFAQSLIIVVLDLKKHFDTSLDMINIAVSLTGLFSGMLVVGAGGLADKIGRVKVTQFGLILSIIGSALMIMTHNPLLLIIGRAIQGISAACLMPATLSIIKAYYDDEDRQRALSYWSFGSWGGSGLCSLFGGLVAKQFGWEWIFIISIVISIIAMILIHGTPETKSDEPNDMKFDIFGLITLILVLLSLNIAITQGGSLGLLNPVFLGLVALSVVSFIAFIMIEKRQANPLIDFDIFRNKQYTGAVISNYLLNAVAGTLIVANTYIQEALGFSQSKTGMLSIFYVITVLSMIIIGEKLLQKMGAKKPMILGSAIVLVGIIMISLTFLPETIYVISCVIGFGLFGLGLGLYATPSTDTAIATSPEEKVGVASGIYKMASALGGAFGIAISLAIYHFFQEPLGLAGSAMIALLANGAMALISLIAIWITVPKDDPRRGK